MSQTPLADFLVSLADPDVLARFRSDPTGAAREAGLPDHLAQLLVEGNPSSLRLATQKELEQAGLSPSILAKLGFGGPQDPPNTITITSNNVTTTVATFTNYTYTYTTTTNTTTTTTTTTSGGDGGGGGDGSGGGGGGPGGGGGGDGGGGHLLTGDAPPGGRPGPDAPIERIIREAGRGALIVVGSGIRAISDLTYDAIAQIRGADRVFYCVADPVTERYLHTLNARSTSLYDLYGNDKPRVDTYREMVDTMLAPVRKGERVCAVFYGHPGVFAWPTHQAVRIAREEGYWAEMRPGISADASLFADLGIDPSIPGLHSLEATDFLIRDRVPDVHAHVLLWQVECVGDSGFNFSGYSRKNFEVLVERLKAFYPDDHPVFIYQAAQLPHGSPTIGRATIGTIRKDDLSGISTLYLPPKLGGTVNEAMLRRLGL